jgi:hypothetical protein
MSYAIRNRDVLRAACTIFACTAIAGCGARKAEAASADTATGCGITLAGAKAGSLNCSDDVGAIYGVKEQVTMVGFTSEDRPSTVMVTIRVPGEPTTKTYRSSDAGMTQGIMVRSGALMWLAQAASGADAAVGSYVLTLTSVKEKPFASDAKQYDVHGTVTATLQPASGSGAKGAITLNAKF